MLTRFVSTGSIYRKLTNQQYMCFQLCQRKNINMQQISIMDKNYTSASQTVDRTPKPHFYRRTLPETCVSFSSNDGKQLFKEALAAGHMDCYFKLAAQFRTQDEPAFCGLSTLVMMLNALEIDPEKVWKGPWRWYHENMLDCCVPVKVIEHDGINFSQFICLAECNGLETLSKSIDESSSLATFRELIRQNTKQDASLIALSYSRKILGQTGDGHFSPVGGYHPERDLLLILDTARFKYPPHWIPVSLMFEAMKALDQTTGKPRGYVVMTKKPKSHSLLLFRISESFGITLKNVCCEGIAVLLDKWKAWLSESYRETRSTDDVVKAAVDWLQRMSSNVPEGQHIFSTQLDMSAEGDISCQHVGALETLLEELEKNCMFKIISQHLNNFQTNYDFKVIGQAGINRSSDCAGLCKSKCLQNLKPAHFVSMFLLCWPYQTLADTKSGTNAHILNSGVCSTISSTDNKYLGNEIRLLRKQFTVLLSTAMKCGDSGSCSIKCK